MTTEETQWLAGWLEGEGWFGIANGGISIQATSVDLDVLKRVGALMQTDKFLPKKPTIHTRQQAYSIRVGGDRAEAIMRAILPFMGERRTERIQACLDFRTAGPERRSAATRNRWANPEMRLKMSEGISRTAQKNRAIRSVYMKGRWADPVFREKMLASQAKEA